MKKISKVILVLTVFGINLSANAQDSAATKTNPHEINIGFANVLNSVFNTSNTSLSNYGIKVPNTFTPTMGYSGYTYFANMPLPKYGISYKYHIKNYALRAGIEFNMDQSDDSFTNNYNGGYYPWIRNGNQHNKSAVILTCIGYERNKHLGRTELFYGMDVFFNYNQYKSDGVTTDSYTTNTSTRTWTTDYKSKYDDYAYGISPLIGIKFHITPMLSFSTQAKLNASYYMNKSRYFGKSIYSNYSIYADTTYFDNNNSSNGMQTVFAPLGLIYLNIHF